MSEPVQTEAQLSAEVRAWLKSRLARGEVLAYYHRPSGRGWGMEGCGFPDWTIALPGQRIVFVELKTRAKASVVKPEQVTWLNAAGSSGAVVRDMGEFVDAMRRWGVV
jgi:hypothetical protein